MRFSIVLMGQCKFMCLLAILFFCEAQIDENKDVKNFFQESRHTNNWAVLVCASRYWFNYRHIANALSVYRSVKRLGIPDSHIILMLSDDMACNARNPRPGKVYNNKNEAIDVYGSDVEVDYRGYEVTVENFIRVLTGRLSPDTPRSKRLNTDDRSNILIYMTGHGGEDFLKFQDDEELSNAELSDAFEQMWQKRRYNELLFIIDTCQAVSMYGKFYSPNIIAIGSSQIGEDSLSHHVDPAIGVYIIDRYTYHLLEYLESITQNSKKNMDDFFKICPKEQCISTPGHSWTSLTRKTSDILITDFFGSVRSVEVNEKTVNLKQKDLCNSKFNSSNSIPSKKVLYKQQKHLFGKIFKNDPPNQMPGSTEKIGVIAFGIIFVYATFTSLC